MATTVATHIEVLAQRAAVWPATDAGWTNEGLWLPQTADEGAGLIVGNARILEYYGNALKSFAVPAATPVAPSTSRCGQFVRLLKRNDATGTVTIGLNQYDPFWWGKLAERGLDDEDGIATYTAHGIGVLLDQIQISGGLEIPGAWTGPTNYTIPGRVPAFNAGKKGNRSASTGTVNGRTVYLFDRYVASPAFWTARQALDYLLAMFGQPRLSDGTILAHRGALSWVISDPSSALGFTLDEIEIHGLTVWEVVNRIVSARRGLDFRITVSGTTATITVRSTVRTAVTVGGYTLPANGLAAALDLSTGVAYAGLALREDHSQVADVVRVEGGRPWYAVTVGYKEGGGSTRLLGQNWTGGTGATIGEGNDAEPVWRSFRINDNWEGAQYDPTGVGGDGIAFQLTLTSVLTAANGLGGYTGARTYAAGGSRDTPPARALSATRYLPWNQGVSGVPSSVDPTKPFAAPLLFLGVGARAGGRWIDISATRHLRIDEQPIALHIGSSAQDAEDLKYSVSGYGYELSATIGVRIDPPLTVSWQRDPTTWPADTPRVRHVQVPQAEYWAIAPNTILGVDAATTNQITSGVTVVVLRNDTPVLEAVLAAARAWYGVSAWELSYRKRGDIDIAAASGPTALITDLTTVQSGTLAVDALICRRSWDFRELEQATTYLAHRIAPEIGAFL